MSESFRLVRRLRNCLLYSKTKCITTTVNRSVLGKRPWEGLDLGEFQHKLYPNFSKISPAAAAVEPFEQIERPSLIGPSVRAKVDRMIIAGPIDETIPVALYHPALAQLTHDLQNRMFGPGNEDLSEFNSGLLEECEHFRLSSCEHYAREDDRLPSTLKFLNAALDAAGHEKPRYFRRNEKNPFAIPDLVWGTQVIRRNEMSLVPYVIGEIKRDRGEGDTILQCTNDYGVIVHNYEVWMHIYYQASSGAKQSFLPARGLFSLFSLPHGPHRC